LGISFGSAAAWGSDLPGLINDYFRQIHDSADYQVAIEIKTPKQQWPACELPEIHPPMSNKNWGNISLPVNCGQQRRFVQIYVHVTGPYLVSNRAIQPNSVLTGNEFLVKTGDLDTLPNDIIHNKKILQNAIAIRSIPAGKFITRNMVRRPWVIKAGQTVTVIAGGQNFLIRNEGKAINNAASFDNIRVRLVSGQVITGQAQENGCVKMML
jgi:flagella basal body P-ring formation protein FlgA